MKHSAQSSDLEQQSLQIKIWDKNSTPAIQQSNSTLTKIPGVTSKKKGNMHTGFKPDLWNASHMAF